MMRKLFLLFSLLCLVGCPKTKEKRDSRPESREDHGPVWEVAD